MSNKGVRPDIQTLASDLAGKSAILYVLGNILDLITTFVLSPDLARETNVMIVRYGFGWLSSSER